MEPTIWGPRLAEEVKSLLLMVKGVQPFGSVITVSTTSEKLHFVECDPIRILESDSLGVNLRNGMHRRVALTSGGLIGFRPGLF